MITFQRDTDPIKMWGRYFVDGALVTPDSIVIDIYNEMDTKVVDGVGMTESATGVYYYEYTPGATAILGDYKVYITGTLSGEDTLGTENFLLEG